MNIIFFRPFQYRLSLILAFSFFFQNIFFAQEHSLDWDFDFSSLPYQLPGEKISSFENKTPSQVFFSVEKDLPKAPEKPSQSNENKNLEFAKKQSNESEVIHLHRPLPENETYFPPPKPDRTNDHKDITQAPPSENRNEESTQSIYDLFKTFQSSETAPTGPPQPSQEPVSPTSSLPENQELKTILINFNNVSIIEFIRFISRITNKNFLFDENDLQFNVTIISEEPTPIDNVMTALIHELRIHDLTLLEQGNNFIIHKNFKVNSISKVVSDEILNPNVSETEIITQVFRLNTADPEKIAVIVRPFVTEKALVEVLPDSNHLIITDVTSNIAEISKLIKSLDSPKAGLVVGQYVVRTDTIDSLIRSTQRIMKPIAGEQVLTFIPHQAANSIFIVSTPFLVERSISILQHLDQNQKSTKIFDLKTMSYEKAIEATEEVLPSPGLFIDGEKFEETITPVETPTKTPTEVKQEEGKVLEKSESKEKTQEKIPVEKIPVEKVPEKKPIEEKIPETPWKEEEGKWIYPIPMKPSEIKVTEPPKGYWELDPKGNWIFRTGKRKEGQDKMPTPKGKWELDPEGWKYILDEGESITVDILKGPEQLTATLPFVKKKNLFYIHNLQYRKGGEIVDSLQNLAVALRNTGRGNEALMHSLSSVQWLTTSNSLFFNGPPPVLDKIEELVQIIDVPLRQVFIEMLILNTTVADSLEYGVSWGSRFGGGNTAGAQGWEAGRVLPTSPLNQALNTTGIPTLGGTRPIPPPVPLPPQQLDIPNPLPMAPGDAFQLGIIGQHIINKAFGLEFNSIGALVRALHNRGQGNLILNPKIITEDSVPAEIFVGQSIPYQTQSVVNEGGGFVTNNYQYRDVGTTLRITPYIGDDDLITLDIAQERSSAAPQATSGNVPNPGPSTNVERTNTRVHMPDGFFLIISGMIEDNHDRDKREVPCLGGIPIIGAAFKHKHWDDRKNNLMIFIRPKIIDSEEEVVRVTQGQQDIWRCKRQVKHDWLYSTEEALDFLNLKKRSTDSFDLEFEDPW